MTFMVYYSWTALASNPDETCNPFYDSVGNTMWQIVAGVIFTGITVTSIATATVSSADKKGDKNKTLANDIIAEDVDGEAQAENAENKQAAIFPVTC